MGRNGEIEALRQELSALESRLRVVERRTTLDPKSGEESVLKGLLRDQGQMWKKVHELESRHNALFSEDPLNPVGAIAELRKRVGHLEYLRDADVTAHEALRETVKELEAEATRQKFQYQSIVGAYEATKKITNTTLEVLRNRLFEIDGGGSGACPDDAPSGALHEIRVALAALTACVQSAPIDPGAKTATQEHQDNKTIRRYEKLAPSTEPLCGILPTRELLNKKVEGLSQPFHGPFAADIKAADDFLESRGLPRVAPEISKADIDEAKA